MRSPVVKMYDPGASVAITCKSYGGAPTPTLELYQDTVLLHSETVTEFVHTVSIIQRSTHNGAKLICKAYCMLAMK